jgi:ankyrin repeat protein
MKQQDFSSIKQYIIPLLILAAVGLAILGNAPQRLSSRPKGDLAAAAFEGNLEKARGLVQKGADVNGRDPGSPGWAPLHYAAAMGHVAMVEFLAEQGADMNLKGGDGSTPLHAAGFMVAGEKSVAALIRKGAAVNAMNAEGKTPLQKYIGVNIYMHSPAIDQLLDGGADPTIVDRSGHSAYEDSKIWDPELTKKLEKYMMKRK